MAVNRTSTYAWKQIRRNRIVSARNHAEPCCRCGLPINYELRWPDRGSPEVDHIIPVARGGDDTPANLGVAHKSCNSSFKDGTNKRNRPRTPAPATPVITTGFLCGRCLNPATARDGHTDCCGTVFVSQDWTR